MLFCYFRHKLYIMQKNHKKQIKAVFNWSGGKDSAHALLRAQQSGTYEIVALLTTVNRSTHRSTMHGIPLPLLQAQADSIGIPLHVVDLTPKGNMEDKVLPISSSEIFSCTMSANIENNNSFRTT